MELSASLRFGVIEISDTNIPSGLAATIVFCNPINTIGMSNSLIKFTLEQLEILPLPKSSESISSTNASHVPKSFHAPL
ncbi:hypothetical protein D3C81_1939430 [compost metagenome]